MPYFFPADSPLIIGHRGARRHFPENTLPSFAFAKTIGSDMVECDLRITADGVIIVAHDATLQRKLVRSMTYDDICRMMPSALCPPRFEDVARFCRDASLALDVEFKEGGYEKEALAILRRYLPPDRAFITSFKDDVLAEISSIAPEYTLGLLIDVPRTRSARQPSISLLARMKACNASVLVVQKSMWRMRRSFMERLKADNIPVVLWTVNQQRTLRRAMQDGGVKGIITDRPEVAHAVRAERAHAVARVII